MSEESNPLGDIAVFEFPMLRGVIEPLLQPLALFVFRDVQEQFHDGRTLVGQHLFEAADVFVATFPNTLRNKIVHANNEDIFIVAAIEDNDSAVAGRVFVDSPQIIVR